MQCLRGVGDQTSQAAEVRAQHRHGSGVNSGFHSRCEGLHWWVWSGE